jgi:meso-butanediol dehydrogenase / (S,S)-butanediol dehydrogenase / diacetyl reductase
MPRYELDGKVAIVTGAGQGIGRAIATRLAREGAAVVVNDLNGERAGDVASEIGQAGGRAHAVAGDVSDAECGKQLVGAAVDNFGRLDILVNNAGVGAAMPLIDTDEETWDRMMRVNAKGVLLCSQAAARKMVEQGEGGRIINNASGAGKIAPGKDHPFGAYAASKHAVVALTKQFGLELAPHKILVNCVCAGIVDTAMWDLIDHEVGELEGLPNGVVKKRAVDSVPLGRIQRPEDVANMVAFLSSDDSDYITATALNVCGGLLPY